MQPTLLKHINDEGYAQGSFTVLNVGGSKMYEAEENRIMLYKVEKDEQWDRYIATVRLYIDRAGVESGVYAWSASIEYEGSTYTLSGTVKAALVTESMENVSCEFTYGEDKIDTELFKYQLKELSKDVLYEVIEDFTEYLDEGNVGLSAKDYGFSSID